MGIDKKIDDYLKDGFVNKRMYKDEPGSSGGKRIYKDEIQQDKITNAVYQALSKLRVYKQLSMDRQGEIAVAVRKMLMR
jgi:hypothetical protein